MAEAEKALSLKELLGTVSAVVNETFGRPVWVVGELTDVRVNNSGHCYMQLIEKDAKRGTMLASARATIWANRWWLIRDSFEQQTGQRFASGLKVMLQVQVQMHEVYGLNLNVLDVDPTYTLGEMARRRMEIIRRLEEDGVIDMNRELPFPTLPQRIAVVSAEGAAGYGDFMKQLEGNTSGLKFYCRLFPAVMQGTQTEASVIMALEHIYTVADRFDVVVIIRGGGATADLASFDSYPLACNVANFPLPVITGIGHDRDQTVLDRVAHTSVKTPTAAAALLIEALEVEWQHVCTLDEQMREAVSRRMEREQQQLLRYGNAIRGTHVALTQQISRTELLGQKVKMLAQQRIQREQDKLRYLAQTVQMAQPDNILKRGFSITRYEGKAVMRAAQVPPGAMLEIETAEGKINAQSK